MRRPPAGDERLNYLAPLGELRGVVLEIEDDGRADADDRNALAAMGNRPRDERIVCRHRVSGESAERAAERRACARGEYTATHEIDVRTHATHLIHASSPAK